MTKYLYTFLIILLASALYAQNELPLQRQYFFNDLVINPATAGSKSYNPASLNYRKQWVGIKDAPAFQSFVMHGLLWNQKVGFGGSIYNSTSGPTTQNGIQLAYSYHISIIKNITRLSFGISAMLNQFLLNEKALRMDQPGDNAIIDGTSKTIVADGTAGLYYYTGGYSTKKYYLGLSASNLLQHEIVKWGSNGMILPKRPKGFFLAGGYEYKLPVDFTFEPSFLLKYYEKTPGLLYDETTPAPGLLYDINAKIAYKGAVWIGGSYRDKESIVAMVGLNGDVIRIGYAYDMGLTSIKKYNTGSHEIYLSLHIKRRELKTM